MQSHQEHIFKTNAANYAIHLWGKEVSCKESEPTCSTHEDIMEYYKNRHNTSSGFLEQVHGNDFLNLTSKVLKKNSQKLTWGKADGFVSTNEKLSAFIKTADCIPILFFHPDILLFGGIHSGWRGLKNRITSAVLNKIEIQNQYAGKSILRNLQLVIGPFIAKESYEVGSDVYQAFTKDCSLDNGAEGKRNLDMQIILKKELRELGILESQCTWLSENTFGNDKYFSHRNGESGRNLSTIIVA